MGSHASRRNLRFVFLCVALIITMRSSVAHAQPRGPAGEEPSQTIEFVIKIAVVALALGLMGYYAAKRRAGIEADPPLEPDENVIALTFARKDVIFASEQDLQGKLVLTTKRLRYIGLHTQKALLSVEPKDIVSISFRGHKMAVAYRTSKGRHVKRKYKLLREVAESEALLRFAGKSFPSAMPMPEFQRAVTEWASSEGPDRGAEM